MMPLVDEMSHRISVSVSVTAGESLIGHVKEGVVSSSLDGIADLFPLRTSGVDAGGVVGAGVQEENATLGSTFDIGEHAFKV